VNAFSDQAGVRIPILEMDPAGEKRQLARLKQLRKERDAGALGQAMDRLRIAAAGTENTMPFILDAVKAYATLGEIMNLMKEAFGVYVETSEI
jgi:methylmalonyl-CoA mutase N-terminal domain/subunit